MEIVGGYIGGVHLSLLQGGESQGGGGHVSHVDGAVLTEHVACLVILRLGVKTSNLLEVFAQSDPETARQPEEYCRSCRGHEARVQLGVVPRPEQGIEI